MALVRLLFAVGGLCSLSACVVRPTPYQPRDRNGGYTDSALDDSTFVISVRGNSETERASVLQYFHRRAKELCTSKGFTDYRVLEEQATSNTKGSVYGGNGTVETSPEHSGRVRCTKSAGSVPPDRWIQVWSDEFDGPVGRGVDGAKWQPDSTDGCQQGNCGWGNQEKEYYSTAAENVALDGGGHLMIVARAAPSALRCYYGPCRYTSGKITTRGKFDTSHGRVEAPIKLPPAGQGLWPAFWLLGADILTTGWPACGELDIMENHGSRSSTTSSAIHGPGYSGQTPFVHSHTLPRGSYADGFHIFAAEWDSLRVQFFVDDSLHYSVERGEVERFGNWVFDKQFFVIVNLAVGGTFDGDPKSDAVLPATMLVDYVRVYRAAAR